MICGCTQKIFTVRIQLFLRKAEKISDTAILEAAQLAAYYSKKARESSQVPVDYTLVRYVSKPSGARPGIVIYVNNKTVYVTPKANISE